MADDITVGNQPQPEAAGGDAGQYDSSDFLGTNPTDLGLDADPNPEPAADETDPEPESADADGETDTTEEDGEAATQSIFEDDVKDSWAKARYARLYQRVLANPEDTDLRSLLKGKIDGDFYLRQLEQQRTAEPAADEAAEEPAAAALDPTQATQQYRQHIDGLVKQYVNPEVAKQIGLDLLEGFGVDTQSKDPEVQALVAKAGSVGARLATSAVDLNMTVLPAMMSNLVEQVFPGFSQMYERALYANAYEHVRTSDPAFAALPDYGSKEFQSAMREAAQQLPGFDSMVFTGRDGKPLPAFQQAQQKYAVLAKMASGQKVNPAVVKQAVETGKKIAQKSAKTVARGRALGAGQSTQQFNAKDNDDPVMADLDRAIAAANAAENPFGRR